MKCLTLLAILISCFQCKMGKNSVSSPRVKNLKISVSILSFSLLLLADCRWSTEATKQIVCVLCHWITEHSKAPQPTLKCLVRLMVVSRWCISANTMCVYLIHILSINPFEASSIKSYSVSVLGWWIYKIS